MRKRVSLAAALINEPSILLMDEPFGALDVQTKAMMSNELLALWEQTRPSVIFVTHDLEEAIALADQVVVMTVGPGTVKAVYDIDLPRPRGAVQEIRFEPRFLELHHQIWESLREEVERAYARTASGRERTGRTVMSAVPVNRSSEPTAPAAIGDLAAAEEAAVAADVRRSTRRRRMLDLGRPHRHAGDRHRRLAAAHQREDHRPVLLGPAQRDRQAAERLGAARHHLRLDLAADLDHVQGSRARLRARRRRPA